MADVRMAQIIAGNNSFQTLASNDVVRLRRGMGGIVIFNPLERKINEIYETFNQTTNSEYTLNISVYPARVKQNTCQEHRTITTTSQPSSWFQTVKSILLDEADLEDTTDTLGVQREVEGIFDSYAPVEGRKPLHFELRQDEQGDIVLCENEQIPNRFESYCGEDEQCIEQIPPLCSSFETSQENACVSLEALKDTAIDTLRNSQQAMSKFCPSECSYYVQTLQKVRQSEDGQHCIENYAIVHCGPKAKKLKYNLNVKVIDDFCEDFNVQCLPQTARPALESVDLGKQYMDTFEN